MPAQVHLEVWSGPDMQRCKRTCLIIIALVGTLAHADKGLLKLKPFMNKYCMDCHDADSEKGDIDFDKY